MQKVDIAFELAKLHILKGADFIRQLKMLASLPLFYPVEEVPNVVTAGGERSEDYEALLNAAKKAVEHGYKVYILPNPKKAYAPLILFLNGRGFSRCTT